jgi:hypothetical protein
LAEDPCCLLRGHTRMTTSSRQTGMRRILIATSRRLCLIHHRKLSRSARAALFDGKKSLGGSSIRTGTFRWG